MKKQSDELICPRRDSCNWHLLKLVSQVKSIVKSACMCVTHTETGSCSLAKSCGFCVGGWGGYVPAGLWLVTPISARSPDLWDVNNVQGALPEKMQLW